MECIKDGYSKKEALGTKNRIYHERNHKSVKLGIYLYPDCKKYHLTHY